MKRKHLFTTIAALLLGTAAFAVLNERSLGQTLAVLKNELGSQNARMEHSRSLLNSSNRNQHARMLDLMQRSNELSLMLYSQNQDFTFDVTYSLRQATREYEEFSKRQMPFNEITERLDIEIERYEKLIESLRRLPPEIRDRPGMPELEDSVKAYLPLLPGDTVRRAVRPLTPPSDSTGTPFLLDSLEQADRDSCLIYAGNLLAMYKSSKIRVMIDSTHYNETAGRLRESYDYAQSRYRSLPNRFKTVK